MKKNLFTELESKMTQKETIEFKISKDHIEKFSIEKKFLNTKIAELLFEYTDIIMYAKENNLMKDVSGIYTMLLIKHFVKQIHKGKEVDIFKPEHTVKSNFETLISTNHALINIVDIEGNSLFDVFTTKLSEDNEDSLKLIQEKMNEFSKNLIKNKDEIIKVEKALAEFGKSDDEKVQV